MILDFQMRLFVGGESGRILELLAAGGAGEDLAIAVLEVARADVSAHVAGAIESLGAVRAGQTWLRARVAPTMTVEGAGRREAHGAVVARVPEVT